jgi:hypothetical protein
MHAHSPCNAWPIARSYAAAWFKWLAFVASAAVAVSKVTSTSLYLAVRRAKRRTMIYIPAALEEAVRQWIETGRETDTLIDVLAQHCLERLLTQKQALGRNRASPAASPRRKRDGSLCVPVAQGFPVSETVVPLTDTGGASAGPPP